MASGKTPRKASKLERKAHPPCVFFMRLALNQAPCDDLVKTLLRHRILMQRNT